MHIPNEFQAFFIALLSEFELSLLYPPHVKNLSISGVVSVVETQFFLFVNHSLRIVKKPTCFHFISPFFPQTCSALKRADDKGSMFVFDYEAGKEFRTYETEESLMKKVRL